jgi:copper(I)-binding protein
VHEEIVRGGSVIRSSRGRVAPRRILIAAAAALVPLIAGCEAGNNAPVLHWHQPTNGTFHAVNNITISNAFVLGAPIGKVLGHGQNAGLFLTLVNAGKPRDRLVGITTPVAQSVQLPPGGVRLAPGSRVLLAGPEPAVLLQNLVKPLTGGSVIAITLLFARAHSATIQVPVMPRGTFYLTYSPAPAPSPSASPAAHGGTSGSPTPSPTGSP